jgi:hypothetical protein
MTWSAPGPRNPSKDGILQHDVSENDICVICITAGHNASGPAIEGRPQQDSKLRSRLRRPTVRSSDFVDSASLDSIAHPSGGRDPSVHIPDHGCFGRNRLHLAGDGPRPVRAGFGLALDYWPEAAQRLRSQGWPKAISAVNAKCP